MGGIGLTTAPGFLGAIGPEVAFLRGRPTKRTPEIVSCLRRFIGLGLNDEEELYAMPYKALGAHSLEHAKTHC